MRTLMFALSMGVVALFSVGASEARAVGTTRCEISNPSYNGPPRTQASVDITMELDSNQTSFTGLSVVVVEVHTLGDKPVAAFIPEYEGPTPGNGPKKVTVTFAVTAGETYKIDATMQYKNAQNQTAYLPDTKTITP